MNDCIAFYIETTLLVSLIFFSKISIRIQEEQNKCKQ